MSNLTFDHHLLKEHTPEPLEGHAVVVFERVGTAGDEFHCVLMPGAAPIRKLLPIPFRRQPEYFAYAVDVAPERHLDFSESMRPADHVSDFRVVFDLAYAVADPRTLAAKRNADPLRRVRDQVKAVLKREVERLSWDAVTHHFDEHAYGMVAECLEELREFAGSFGIAIRSLRLRVRLPGEVEDVHRTEAVTRVKAESAHRIAAHGQWLDIQGAEVATAARVVDGQARLDSALIDSTIAAIQTNNFNAADDLVRRRGTYTALGAAPGAGAPGWTHGGMSAPPGMLNAGVFTGAPALPASTSPAGGALAAVLNEVVTATSGIRGKVQKSALRAALLHLVAEMLTDDMDDGTEAARRAAHAQKAIAALSPAPAGADADALKALADTDQLRARLDL